MGLLRRNKSVKPPDTECIRGQLGLQYSAALFDTTVERVGEAVEILGLILDNKGRTDDARQKRELLDRNRAFIDNLKVMKEPLINRAVELAASGELPVACDQCTGPLRFEPCAVARLAIQAAFNELGSAQLQSGPLRADNTELLP